MNKTKSWLKRLSRVECPNTTFIEDEFPIVLKKGAGMHLWDIDGKRYTDFTACFGVSALGHRPKIVVNALRKQTAKLIHGMGDVHPTESKIRLLILLSQMLPYTHPRVLLSSTGSEAVETALKTAVLATGKTKFLSFSGAYHGLMTGPLRLLNREHFTDGFDEWLSSRATVLPFPAEGPEAYGSAEPAFVLNQLEEECKKRCYAALVLEPVQGRGGDRSFPDGFIKTASELARKYDALVIFDEIFTGFGRTGKMFAFEDCGVIPDLICLGKALGGGLPLSACAGEVLEVWGKSNGEARHTSTFLGHPLACATAHATIKEIGAKLPSFNAELKKIELAFHHFLAGLKKSDAYEKHPFIINGKGFMKGLWFHNKKPGFAFDMTKKLLHHGFIVLPSGEDGNVLSLTPPLIAKAEHYQKLFKAIEATLSKID